MRNTPMSTTTDTRTDTPSTFRGMYGGKACTFIIRDGAPYGTVLLDRDPGYGSMILSTVPRTAVTVSTVSLVKGGDDYWTARIVQLLAQQERDAEEARLRTFRVYGHPGFTRTTIAYRKG